MTCEGPFPPAALFEPEEIVRESLLSTRHMAVACSAETNTMSSMVAMVSKGAGKALAMRRMVERREK